LQRTLVTGLLHQLTHAMRGEPQRQHRPEQGERELHAGLQQRVAPLDVRGFVAQHRRELRAAEQVDERAGDHDARTQQSGHRRTDAVMLEHATTGRERGDSLPRRAGSAELALQAPARADHPGQHRERAQEPGDRQRSRPRDARRGRGVLDGRQCGQRRGGGDRNLRRRLHDRPSLGSRQDAERSHPASGQGEACQHHGVERDAPGRGHAAREQLVHAARDDQQRAGPEQGGNEPGEQAVTEKDESGEQLSHHGFRPASGGARRAGPW
jgi:hypothetical protein